MKGLVINPIDLRKLSPALVERLSWLKHHPVHQKTASLILGQGTYLGCEFDPQAGHVWEATD